MCRRGSGSHCLPIGCCVSSAAVLKPCTASAGLPAVLSVALSAGLVLALLGVKLRTCTLTIGADVAWVLCGNTRWDFLHDCFMSGLSAVCPRMEQAAVDLAALRLALVACVPFASPLGLAEQVACRLFGPSQFLLGAFGSSAWLLS